MTLYLWELVKDTYQELGQLNISKATGGTTTTIVDSTLAKQYDNNVFEKGMALIIHDAGDASAAPEGEFARISGNTGSSGTFTLTDTLTAAPAAGDTYGFTSRRYPLLDVIYNINRGLQRLGDIAQVDTTTLDSAENQTEYSLSKIWKRGVYRIDIQTNTGDANKNLWHTVEGWEQIPYVEGSAALIETLQQWTGSRDLRIWYKAPHTVVRDFDDEINEYIHPDLAKWASVHSVLKWMNGRMQGDDDGIKQDLNDSKEELYMAAQKFPIQSPSMRKRKRGLFTLSAPRYENLKTPV